MDSAECGGPKSSLLAWRVLSISWGETNIPDRFPRPLKRHPHPHPFLGLQSSSESAKLVDTAAGSHLLPPSLAGAPDFWMCKQAPVAFLSRHCSTQAAVHVSMGEGGQRVQTCLCTSSVEPGGAGSQGHLGTRDGQDGVWTQPCSFNRTRLPPGNPRGT